MINVTTSAARPPLPPFTRETAIQKVRMASDHVVIVAEQGKHIAFPGVARLTDGSLAAVFREGTAHVDPSGKISLCRSLDGGRTWSPRVTVYDDPKVDERDPGICQHSSGTLIVSFASRGAQTVRSGAAPRPGRNQLAGETSPADLLLLTEQRTVCKTVLLWLCRLRHAEQINQTTIAAARDEASVRR